MTKKIFSILIVFLVCLQMSAQIRGTNIVVMVQPDHKDWNYQAGQMAVFKVSVLKSSTLLSNVRVDYEAGPVEFPTVKKEGVILKDGTMTWKGSMDEPGFYRLKVTAHVGGKTYEGLCTAGFSPQKIQPSAQCPENFDIFWGKALEKARTNGLNATRRLLPARCTQEMNVYEISYVNDQPESRIYGVLSVPTRPGRYPALLRVPGAGVRPYQGDTYTAPGEAIILEIGVHGIPVTMDPKVYDDLLYGALRNYSYTNLDDPDQNYYKRVVVGAVRGVDYIASLPEWDGKTIGVTGASQGGFLSLAVAALDRRVTFLAAVHDAMCDYESELKGVAGGWPHYFLYDKHPTQQKIKAVRYYDGDNFARRCHVPAWFSFGYNDETVPPTSSYGIYNIYPGPKTLSVYQQTGHYWYQEQWDEWQAWLCGKLSTPASQLMARLLRIQKKGIMIGHQDDPVYGHGWKWEKGRSDVREVCGDYPAVMGFELGGIELGQKENIDHVPFDRIRQEIINQYERGGVITLSWHPFNPVTGKNAWDTSGNPVRKILPGGSRYRKFEGWLKTVAVFCNSLRTPAGRKIPVIFRPWHEMGGTWFWWGSKGTTPEEYKRLYIFTCHQLTSSYGCDNLVWAYSPNSGIDDYMKYYPGNRYVDLLGIDLYDFNHDNAVYEKNLRNDLEMLRRFGEQQGKLIALTETGAQTLPDSTWFTRVFWPVAKEYPVCYALFWRNAWDNPKELYMAAPGLSVEKDFKTFSGYRRTLFAKDIEEMK